MFARTALRTPVAAVPLPSSPMVSTRRAPSAVEAKAKAPLSTSVKKTAAAKKKPSSVSARSSAGDAVSTTKGLAVGGKFPSLGKLETDEGTFVDLDVSELKAEWGAWTSEETRWARSFDQLVNYYAFFSFTSNAAPLFLSHFRLSLSSFSLF